MDRDLGCWEDVELWECFSSPEILELKVQCELARCRGAAPDRLQCPFGLSGLLEFYELHFYPSLFLSAVNLTLNWQSFALWLVPLPHFDHLLMRLVFQNKGRLQHFLGPL
jgi:hypothetical protein